MTSENIDQESGNYNVFCQSCGRVIGVNIDSHKKALDLEKEHLEERDCVYTGTHSIREK